jgi:hypothetical protein
MGSAKLQLRTISHEPRSPMSIDEKRGFAAPTSSGAALRTGVAASGIVLEAIPKHWYSWDYTVAHDGVTVADIDVSSWREKGVVTIEDVAYRAYRERLMGGAFLLERDGELLARAVKPSALSRRIMIEHDGVSFTLRPRSALGRSFQLVDSVRIAGILTPRSAFSRRMKIDFWVDLPLPVTVFVIWLTVILWKRDADGAGAG